MEQHFLQSPAWEKYEQLEGHETFRLDEPAFSALAILHSTPFGNYLYCPYGPAIKDSDNPFSFESALSALKNLAKKHNAFFIRIEPTFTPIPGVAEQQFASLGLKKSHDLNPAHTWALDLAVPKEEILGNIEKRKIRHWRTAAKHGIILRQTQNPAEISILTDLLQNLGERDKFTPQDENHLKNQLKSGFTTLYVADLTDANGQKSPIAAALVYDHAGTRYYAHAATDDAHRKLMAGTIILIQLILDAQAAGAKTFDFWGITTSTDPNHPWYGFTQYKKSFGGHQIDYAGTFDLPLAPVKYRLYLLFRRLNRLKRKFLH